MQGIQKHKTQKGSRTVKLDMVSEKNMRMEEIGNGQQEMQEKIAQIMKMVTNLIKEKGIIDDSSLQKEPTSRGDGIDPFIVPNRNDPFEREQLRENLPRQSENINLQQRCNLLDKRLKEIKGWMTSEVWTLKSYPWSLTWSYRPNSKCQHLKSMTEPNSLRTIWPRIVARRRGTPMTKVY